MDIPVIIFLFNFFQVDHTEHLAIRFRIVDIPVFVLQVYLSFSLVLVQFLEPLFLKYAFVTSE